MPTWIHKKKIFEKIYFLELCDKSIQIVSVFSCLSIIVETLKIVERLGGKSKQKNHSLTLLKDKITVDLYKT